MCAHEILSADREKSLARKIRAGGPEGQQARDELVRHNLRLVLAQAQYYEQHGARGLPVEDLFQSGVIGLLTAAEKFDPARGFKFSTMAVWWIRQAIQRAIAHQADSIRVSDQTHKASLTKSSYPEESDAQLAARLKITPAQFRNRLRNHVAVVASIDTRVSADDAEFHLPDDYAEAEFEAVIDEPSWLADALASLPADQRRFIELRFGLNDDEPLSMVNVREAMGLTRAEARELEKQALRTLRKFATVPV